MCDVANELIIRPARALELLQRSSGRFDGSTTVRLAVNMNIAKAHGCMTARFVARTQIT